MRPQRPALLLALAFASGVLPGVAAGQSTVTAVARTALTRPVVELPRGTRLVGVTWPRGAHGGTGPVALRWRTAAGWSAWAELEADATADPGTAEAAQVRPGTEPAWAPAGALAVEVRGTGRAGAELVTVGERRSGWSFGRPAAHASTGRTRLGAVVTRAAWGAAKPAEAPEYARRVDAIAVHHTVNANDYTAAEAPALVRSIQAYHQKGRGYADIAYNLLVDRFGRVYEGRAGGIDRAVVGAHTQGFNTGTAGVAMLGNLDVAEPAPAMTEAVARVGAYLSERWRFDPRTSVALASQGSPRYPRGARPVLPRVFGHRDTGATACPGRYAYPKLPSVRARAWRLLAPVIADVRVEGVPLRPPEPATVTARLTAAAAWRVEVVSPYGGVVAETSGRGTGVALAWDGMVGDLPALPGEYRWTATADDGVHGPSDPVTGTFQVLLPAVTG